MPDRPTAAMVAAIRRRHERYTGSPYAADHDAHADRGVLLAALAQYETLARALVEALPRCTWADIDDSKVGLNRILTCSAPATKAHGRGGPRYCDEHAPADCPDYPRAAPLRALKAALEGR